MTFEHDLRALLEKATPGPWEYVLDNTGYPLIAEVGGGVVFAPENADQYQDEPDAESALAIFQRNRASEVAALVEAARYWHAVARDQEWCDCEEFEGAGVKLCNWAAALEALDTKEGTR